MKTELLVTGKADELQANAEAEAMRLTAGLNAAKYKYVRVTEVDPDTRVVAHSLDKETLNSNFTFEFSEKALTGKNVLNLETAQRQLEEQLIEENVLVPAEAAPEQEKRTSKK